MVKKYRCIAKAGKHNDGGDHFIKHNVNNLIKYTEYLDSRWPDWKYFNVFDKNSREQLASFTKNQKPINKWV